MWSAGFTNPNQQWRALRFGFHTVGRYRLVGSPSWFLVCWNCGGMKGCLIRGWDLDFPVGGATSTLAGGATLAARWLHEPQPISNQPVGLGFPYRCGAVSTWDPRFRARGVGLVEMWKNFDSGMGVYYPWVRQDLGVVRRGYSRCVLAP